MRGRRALLALGALFLATATAAQSPAGETIDPDLRCAVWAAVAGGYAEAGEERAGYDAVFTYFMGRFEGRGGQRIEDFMTAELIVSEFADWEALTAFCQPRAVELGARLVTFGEALQQAAPTEPAPETY